MNKIIDFKKFLSSLNESVDSDLDLINKIDYTLLNPSATEDEILELCEKADKLSVKSVCVLPKMVSLATVALKNSDVLVCTVISFPHGTDTTEQKLAETRKAISDGADECDMVLNYPLLKKALSNEDEYDDLISEVENDVSELVEECHHNTNKDEDVITLKVIVESGLLNLDETEEAIHICLDAGADFIKTSTGMVAIGAELNKVKLMKKIIQEQGLDMKIKASGGIRTMQDLENFEPYVDRFGVGFAAVDSIFGNKENTSGDGY